MLDFSYINTNPYFAGVSLLMLNLGSRYVVGDIGHFLDNILKHDITKKFIIWALFFVGTRDVIKSLVLTIVFTIIVYGLFNEKSRYSLVPNDKKVKNKLKEYYQNIQIIRDNENNKK
jgi:hypothetical protein